MTFSTHPHPGGLDLTSRAVALADIPTKARVLDAGCGDGETCDLLTELGYEAYGIDTQPLPEETGSENIKQGSIQELSWDDNYFDAVVCECVLSVCGDENKALQEFYRVLAPRGKLILSDVYQIVPDEEGEESVLACGKLLSEEEIRSTLKNAGFRLIKWEERSDDLRTLVLQTLWDEGSIDSLGFTGGIKGTGRIGYYLVIAEPV